MNETIINIIGFTVSGYSVYKLWEFGEYGMLIVLLFFILLMILRNTNNKRT